MAEPPSPHMARALALARAAKGRTSPNPAVGAVVVRDGAVVGEGATQPGGRPHAEPVALAAAGSCAEGAALYVTLEPCSHVGRTAPCADAVIAAGVKRVHVATLDPNPRVAGQGMQRLRRAGIEITVGDGLDEARALNEDFACWVTTGRPWVMAKFAASLDGRTATHTGESRWITGPEARAEGHRWRDRVDAILVGAGTVLADDPALTTRLAETTREPKHPWRLILDSQCRTPTTARVLSPDLPGRTTIVTTGAAPPERLASLENTGAEVLVIAADGGRVDLQALLRLLGERQTTSLLVEGGATVHGAFFSAGLVDYLLAFLAPMVIGGTQAPGAVGGQGVATLAAAPRLLQSEVRRVGVDTLVAGYLRRAAWLE